MSSNGKGNLIKTRGNTKLTDEKLEMIFALYQEGFSFTLIGDLFGVDHSTIIYHVKKNKITKEADVVHFTRTDAKKYKKAINAALGRTSPREARRYIRNVILKNIKHHRFPKDPLGPIAFENGKSYKDYKIDAKIKALSKLQVRRCPDCGKLKEVDYYQTDPVHVTCNMCYHKRMVRLYGRRYRSDRSRET